MVSIPQYRLFNPERAYRLGVLPELHSNFAHNWGTEYFNRGVISAGKLHCRPSPLCAYTYLNSSEQFQRWAAKQSNKANLSSPSRGFTQFRKQIAPQQVENHEQFRC